jgi:hypothetical protein
MNSKNLKIQNLVVAWLVFSISLIVFGLTSFLLIQNGIQSWRAPDIEDRITANLFLSEF